MKSVKPRASKVASNVPQPAREIVKCRGWDYM